MRKLKSKKIALMISTLLMILTSQSACGDEQQYVIQTADGRVIKGKIPHDFIYGNIHDNYICMDAHLYVLFDNYPTPVFGKNDLPIKCTDNKDLLK